MKQLFNTKLRIILVIAVLVTAGLSVLSGLTNQSIPDLPLCRERRAPGQGRSLRHPGWGRPVL